MLFCRTTRSCRKLTKPTRESSSTASNSTPEQVRAYMAQSAMPHLEGRVVDLACSQCGEPHFEQGEHAFTPHIDHECHGCGHVFQAPGQIKKTIGNPFVGVRRKLALAATGPLREDKLGLRPETI